MQSVPMGTTEETRAKLRALSNRDLQLWSIGLLALLVSAAGFAALVAPDLVWGTQSLTLSTRYLPQLLFGFIVLIVLFNIYVLGQRRELEAVRQDLILELTFAQRVQNLSLIDPLTQIFNRRYLDYVIPREIVFSNRHKTPLTFLLFDLDDFTSINSHYGHMAGDQLLVDAVHILKNAFDATETLLRYGGDEFLAVLPETSGEQALERVAQVLAEVKLWNQSAGVPYRMGLSYGVASYHPGCDVKDVLDLVVKNMRRYRKQATLGRSRNLRPDLLIVGCDPDTEQVLVPMLESLSVDVEVCAESDTAFSLMQGRRFEAIIVDTDVPEVAKFVHAVRNQPSVRNAIIVALGPRSDSARLGANFVLDKPLVPARVSRILRVVHTLMVAERQRYFRHPISAAVTLDLEKGSSGDVVATDISEGGMAVRSKGPLEAGCTGTIRFSLPEHTQILQSSVEVAWADRNGRAGLRFVNMPPHCRGALESWLREHLNDIGANRVLYAASGEQTGEGLLENRAAG